VNGHKIFVTGGSGFIGSAVVDALAEQGFAIANFDARPPAHDRHRQYWTAGDILDEARLRQSLGEVRPDAVIHLAARADIVASDWADFASIHRGTANILAAAAGREEVKRLINISTQLVIGPGYAPRSLTDFHPYTVYGEAKAHAEQLLMQWQAPISWLTIRPTNIWGPGHPSFADAIWKYIRNRVYLHPSGRPVFRTYGFVENMADQIVALLKADPAQTARQTYYGGDAVLDSAAWVDAFALALTGKRARRMPAPLLKLLGRAGDLAAAAGIGSPINSGRVMRMTQSYEQPLEPMLALVGAPKISLAEGVEKSVAWLRSLGRGAA
jgi:nucleoside-diphosphate-sugar epimerase